MNYDVDPDAHESILQEWDLTCLHEFKRVHVYAHQDGHQAFCGRIRQLGDVYEGPKSVYCATCALLAGF